METIDSAEDSHRYKTKKQLKHQYPDSTRNNNPIQVCANCSKLLETGTEKEAIFDIEVSEQFNLASSNSAATITNAYENKFGEPNSSQKMIKVKKILESVYKLHYLDLLAHPETKSTSDSSDLLGMHLENVDDDVLISSYKNICLCSPCSHVLTSMYKYYLLFSQLRQMTSFLAKKINRLDEMVETQSQRHQRLSRPTRTQSQGVDDALTPVIKCEVLMENANDDENIFADDTHFDDVNDLSQDQYTQNEEFGCELSARNKPMARVSVPDLVSADIPIRNDSSHEFVNENYQQDFHHNQDSAVPCQTLLTMSSLSVPVLVQVPVPGTVDGKNTESESLASVPWVRLERLRNVRIGCPVRVSLNQNQSRNSQEFEKLLVETGRKTRKSNQMENIHLISSGPSDNDDSNDSDFQIESESVTSKRNLSLRSNRKTSNPRRRRNQDKATITAPKPLYGEVSKDDDSTPHDNNDQDGRTSEPAQKQEAKRPSPSKTKSKAKKSPTRNKGGESKSNRKDKAIKKLPPSAEKEEKLKQARRQRYRVDKGYRRRKARAANPCWHCPLDFPTQEECYAHAKATHYKPGDIICPRCAKVCTNKKSSSLHQSVCESLCPGEKRTPYRCHECNKGFALKTYLNSHQYVHSKIRNFPCPSPGCSYKAKTSIIVNMHFKRKHVEGEPTFQTGEDGQLIVVEPVLFKCDRCDATFKSEASRKIHTVTFHTEAGFKKYREQQRAFLDRQKEERKMKTARKSTICPECNVDLLTNLRLICHRKTVHNVANKFVCHVCGRDFCELRSLRYHMKYSHTESRPFMCEHCGKAFKTIHNVKAHVSRTHSEEGRRKYNELHRNQNQLRKLVAEALANKPTTGRIDSDSTEDNVQTGIIETESTESKTTDNTVRNVNVNSVGFVGNGVPRRSAATSTVTSALSNFAVPGQAEAIQRLMNSWN